MKKLFENYYNDLSTIASKESRSELFTGDFHSPRYFEKGGILNEEKRGFVEKNNQNKVLTEFDKNQLVDLFGPNTSAFDNLKIGTHPDFSDLQYHEYLHHFCVSMFMDIKGSTRLIEKYSLSEIRSLKDTVLTLAIHVASHFGGHIHRLQGDGVFIQFVKKVKLLRTQ